MRAVRKRAGLTQTDIAEKLQTSQSAISKIEAGNLAPPLLIWMSFCKEMGIDAVEAYDSGFVDFLRSQTGDPAADAGNFRMPGKYLTDRHTSVRWILPIIKFYHERHGTEKLRAFLKKEMRVDPDFLVILDHSVNMQFALDFAKLAADNGDLVREDFADIAKYASDPDFQGFLRPLLNRALNSRDKLLQVISNIDKYESNFVYRVESQEPNAVRVSITPSEHLKNFDYLNSALPHMCCEYRKGFLRAVGHNSNETAPKISEHQCIYDGADRCIYEIEIA